MVTKDPPADPSPVDSWSAFLDALPGSVYLLHPDGTYAYLSPGAARRLAVAPETCLGKPWNCVPLPQQAAVPFEARRQEVISTGEAVSGGLRITLEQGCRWYDYTVSPIHDGAGAVAYVMVTLRENPARLELEEHLTRARYALHEAETKLSRARTACELLERAGHGARLAEQAFLGAGVLLVLLDVHGHILRVNHACETASGQPECALRGEAFWAALVTPDEEAHAREAFAQVFVVSPCACRLVLAGSDTSRRPVEWLLTTLPDVSGVAAGVVGAGRVSEVVGIETAPVSLLLPEEQEEHRQSAA
ncbi:MAG: PAS fold protein [bacterium ADurb.Bin429]|nr:MAG: PAS fold protein [bacterium ADurb.Bin429]